MTKQEIRLRADLIERELAKLPEDATEKQTDQAIARGYSEFRIQRRQAKIQRAIRAVTGQAEKGVR